MKVFIKIGILCLTGCLSAEQFTESEESKKQDILVVEQSQISKINNSSKIDVLIKNDYGSIRSYVCDGNIYVKKGYNIIIYNKNGEREDIIPIPSEVRYSLDFVVLPNRHIAFLDNKYDAIYFINERGEYLKTVSLFNEPNNHLQNMSGIVVGENLIVSENGFNEVISVNLETYKHSTFRNLKQLRSWLGGIAYHNGRYYICLSRDIYSFSNKSDELLKIGKVPYGNITGIAIQKDRILVVSNGLDRVTDMKNKFKSQKGLLYEIKFNENSPLINNHLSSNGITLNEITPLIDNLSYPQDVYLLNSSY